MTDHTLSRQLAALPRLGLAMLPTPLESLQRLSAHLGGPHLWMKREDCTGLACGGNKLRKLDYLLPAALSQGVDTLVSGGVVQSNSQRQVAAVAAKLGLNCHLAVFQGRLPSPPAEYSTSGNALLNKLLNATLHEFPWTGDRQAALTALAQRLADDGQRPYVIPYGVSNALGCIAYATAAEEIAWQARERGFTPSAIVHATGSAGTQAGLVLGAEYFLPATRIIGIDVDAEPHRVRNDILTIGRAAGTRMNLPFPDHKVEVLAGHAGAAYGMLDSSTLEAIKLAARLEALLLDPVYTGKALAGLLALIRQGRWQPHEHVVFVHTGGVPALFAYQSALGL